MLHAADMLQSLQQLQSLLGGFQEPTTAHHLLQHQVDKAFCIYKINTLRRVALLQSICSSDQTTDGCLKGADVHNRLLNEKPDSKPSTIRKNIASLCSCAFGRHSVIRCTIIYRLLARDVARNLLSGDCMQFLWRAQRELTAGVSLAMTYRPVQTPETDSAAQHG